MVLYTIGFYHPRLDASLDQSTWMDNIAVSRPLVYCLIFLSPRCAQYLRTPVGTSMTLMVRGT